MTSPTPFVPRIFQHDVGKYTYYRLASLPEDILRTISKIILSARYLKLYSSTIHNPFEVFLNEMFEPRVTCPNCVDSKQNQDWSIWQYVLQ
jgi:hypothetical protein